MPHVYVSTEGMSRTGLPAPGDCKLPNMHAMCQTLGVGKNTRDLNC